MKQSNPRIGLSKICRLFGITRQAYYGQMNRSIDRELAYELIIQQVVEIRKQHPRMGTRKLYIMLTDFYAGTSDKDGQRCFV